MKRNNGSLAKKIINECYWKKGKGIIPQNNNFSTSWNTTSWCFPQALCLFYTQSKWKSFFLLGYINYCILPVNLTSFALCFCNIGIWWEVVKHFVKWRRHINYTLWVVIKSVQKSIPRAESIFMLSHQEIYHKTNAHAQKKKENPLRLMVACKKWANSANRLIILKSWIHLTKKK